VIAETLHTEQVEEREKGTKRWLEKGEQCDGRWEVKQDE